MRRAIRFALPMSVCMGACNQDSSFTKLADPEPPAEDTSVPPAEVDAEVVDEPEPSCDDPGLVPASLATVDESCRNEALQSRFRAVIEWSRGTTTPFETFPSHAQSVIHPSVGHFNDDNGDGIIGSGDIPDIAAQFWDGGDYCLGSWNTKVLRLLSGDGSGEHWSVEGIPGEPDWDIGWVGNAIGDIDGDGMPEIVVLVQPIYTLWDEVPNIHRVAAFNHDGSLAWLSEPRSDGTELGCGRDTCGQVSAPSLFDINQDGVVEVFVGPGIYDGRDGTAWDMPEDWDDTIVPVVTDLEGDGLHEVITKGAIYEQDLTLRCRFGWPAQHPAVADMDGDGVGEVVLSGSRAITIVDNQCFLRHHAFLGDDGDGGPATVADYDGDGQPEIGVASYSYYFVMESDLTELWRAPVSDGSSNQTGSSVYDFDGDGYAEVVYAGELNLWIYSGVDGTVRLQETSQDSCTTLEYPITVDVDGDGQIEIVLVDGNGIRVVGDRDNTWVPGREIWNQHAYSIFNVNDDLTIPAYQRANWPEFNSFRSADQRLNNGDGANLVDAYAMEVDRCEVECAAGMVQLTLRGANQGLADATDGINLALYAEQADGSRSLLETIPADVMVRSAYTTEGYTLRLEMVDLPTGTLILVADDDGTGMGVIEECDEENNELRLEGLCADD